MAETTTALPPMPLFDNLFWHALSGRQSHLSLGDAAARRFAPGLPPMIGFADLAHPDFSALNACCAVGESFFCEGWHGEAVDGWRIAVDTTMVKMVWRAPVPAEPSVAAVVLGPEHLDHMLALAELTQPGPIGPRTPELGQYLGCLVDGQLVAMAGERLAAGHLREISGVCTHPDHQGQGLARQLVQTLVARQCARGETPVLHVLSSNTAARGLYRRMGFAEYREVPVRVVVREG